MNILNLLIAACWIVFILYWGISAVGVKKNIKRKGEWAKGSLLRLAFAVILVLIFIYRPAFIGGVFRQPENNFWGGSLGISGVVLCAAGIALAIWARRNLGKNWSSYPTLKESHELIISGPYRFVRHPIYTGMLLALFGSALVLGLFWFIFFFFICFVFINRVFVEERLMLKQFPDKYPEYRKKTKALIPFVW
jgi:protein-S-isoprenylcysteine O-methyltransferase